MSPKLTVDGIVDTFPRHFSNGRIRTAADTCKLLHDQPIAAVVTALELAVTRGVLRSTQGAYALAEGVGA